MSCFEIPNELFIKIIVRLSSQDLLSLTYVCHFREQLPDILQIEKIERKLRDGTFKHHITILKETIPRWIAGEQSTLDLYVLKRFQNFIYPIGETNLVEILTFVDDARRKSLVVQKRVFP